MSDFILGLIIGIVAETCIIFLFLVIIFLIDAHKTGEEEEKMYSGDGVDDDDDIF